jgi:hypothetical protein
MIYKGEKMRDLFPGHYRPNDSEFQDMWLNGLFVFDANVLLDIYRYSDETADSLLKTFEKLENRIWIPYQAALEYHRNINTVIASEAKNYADAIKEASVLLTRFSKKRNHPFISQKLYKEIESIFESLNSELEANKISMEALLTENPLKDRLASILSGKIGECFSEQKLTEIYEAGEKRFSTKTPPGYEDAKNKKGDEKYGDLVVWTEIIEKAKSIDSPLIFVTGDSKSDWFLEEMGKKTGPRPELIAELKQNKNIPFYIYSTYSYLEYANTFLAVDVGQEALDEVKQIEIQIREKPDYLTLSEVSNVALGIESQAKTADITGLISLAAQNKSAFESVLGQSGMIEMASQAARIMAVCESVQMRPDISEAARLAAQNIARWNSVLAQSGISAAASIAAGNNGMWDPELNRAGREMAILATAQKNRGMWESKQSITKCNLTKNDNSLEEDKEV